MDGVCWLCKDKNGVCMVDMIEFETSIYWFAVTAINCVPCAVLGVGDIPYQAFELGKLNMGSVHCNYCDCPSTKFGEEETIEVTTHTHEFMVSEGTKYCEYIKDKNEKLARKEKVQKYEGAKGITSIPYSLIPVNNWINPELHIGLG